MALSKNMPYFFWNIRLYLHESVSYIIRITADMIQHQQLWQKFNSHFCSDGAACLNIYLLSGRFIQVWLAHSLNWETLTVSKVHGCTRCRTAHGAGLYTVQPNISMRYNHLFYVGKQWLMRAGVLYSVYRCTLRAVSWRAGFSKKIGLTDFGRDEWENSFRIPCTAVSQRALRPNTCSIDTGHSGAAVLSSETF